jgi:hypothetical protein
MSAPDRRKLVDREHRAFSPAAVPRRWDWSIGHAGALCARLRQGCRQRSRMPSAGS